MRCDIIPIADLDRSALDAWRELSASAISPNPFAEPEFVLPAMRAWNVDDIHVLVVREGSDWIAALPVRRRRSHRGVPGSCLTTWRHSYCYLGTPLVAPVDPPRALERLIAGGAQDSGVLVLEWLEADGPLSETMSAALASVSRPVEVEHFGRAALYHRDDGGYLERAISANHRSQYRRLRRRLEQEVGPLVLRDESATPERSHEFLAIESSGWKGQAGTALATRGHGEFFVQICTAFAQTGRLRLLALAGEEVRLAMSCGLLAGDTTYEFKIAFDDRYRRYSPGTQLLISSMDHFHASDLRRLDSCADFDNAWTSRFFADRRELRTVAAAPRTPAGALQATKWRAAAAGLRARRQYQARGGREALLRGARERIGNLRRGDRGPSSRHD